MSNGKGVMSSTTDADFPRLEYTLAKGPHYLGLLGGAAIAAYLILMAVEAVAHRGPWSSSVGRMVSGAVLFSIALGVGLKLISRIDFEKVMLILDRDGVWVARPRGTTSPHGAATTIPWSIILKIKYYEIGRLKQTKMIAIDLRETGEVRIDANLFRCGKVFLGRSLSCLAIALSLAWLCKDRSVPRGRYWRILIRTALPRRSRIAEVNLNVGGHCQSLVICQFLASIPG